MKTIFNVNDEPLPWRIAGDQILNANGGCVMIFDPDDQSGIWDFIVEAVNSRGNGG
jgi:hypothetical protein